MRRSKRAQGATPAGAGDPVASSERAREAAQRTPGTPARARAPPPASSPATPAVGAPSRDASAARTRRELQRERIASAPGFIAALDQSGGSTPRALAAYGITDIRGDEAHMFALVHDMRTRILTADAFSSERIIGAILFEDTVFNRLVEGLPTATYAWNEKGIVPFLKIDKGLEPEKDGVRLMKPIPDLADLLARCGDHHHERGGEHPDPDPARSPAPLPAAVAAFNAHFRAVVDATASDDAVRDFLESLAERTEPYLRVSDAVPDGLDHGVVRAALVAHHARVASAEIADAKARRRSRTAEAMRPALGGAAAERASDAGPAGECVFGTKARSVIRAANAVGIRALVAQQFAVAAQVLAAGLVPIVEPEVDIACPDKAEAEETLRRELEFYLDALPPNAEVCLKLTIPDDPTLYADFASEKYPGVLRVFALSGGYSREEANARLAKCPGMSASFSRALAEGLRADASDEEFEKTLRASVESIYDAAVT